MVVLPWKKIALPIYGMFKQNNDTWGWNGGCWWDMKPEKILIVVLAIMSLRSKWPATSCHQAHERGLFPSLIQVWFYHTSKKVALFQSYGCHYSHPRVGWWWDQWDAMGSSASPALLAILPAIPTPSRFWYSIQLDGRPWWPCLPGPWTRGSVRDGYGGISKWYFWKWITGEII